MILRAALAVVLALGCLAASLTAETQQAGKVWRGSGFSDLHPPPAVLFRRSGKGSASWDTS